VNTAESKEVNKKIIELEKDRHINDINEAKDENEMIIRNISFKDRLKRKNSSLEEKEKKEDNDDNNNNQIEIKEEIIEENKSENNNETIKLESVKQNEENKIEIKSINNKTPSRNNSKSSSLSKKI
jgi:hypothetical protein